MINRILKATKWLFAPEGDPTATMLQVAILFLMSVSAEISPVLTLGCVYKKKYAKRRACLGPTPGSLMN